MSVILKTAVFRCIIFPKDIHGLNLGCLHPVARVRSDDVGFYPSTQRHYRRLIYYLYNIATRPK
jgi:hypothetical protein